MQRARSRWQRHCRRARSLFLACSEPCRHKHNLARKRINMEQTEQRARRSGLVALAEERAQHVER